MKINIAAYRLIFNIGMDNFVIPFCCSLTLFFCCATYVRRLITHFAFQKPLAFHQIFSFLIVPSTGSEFFFTVIVYLNCISIGLLQWDTNRLYLLHNYFFSKDLFFVDFRCIPKINRLTKFVSSTIESYSQRFITGRSLLRKNMGRFIHLLPAL